MNKKVPIRYSTREYSTIKRDLVEYAKRYYPDTFKDFNEAGFGPQMLDTVAYVGDILSFYLDYSVNESFLDSSIEYNNVIRHGKSLGYKFAANPSSFGVGVFYLIVPAKTLGLGPNTAYVPKLMKGSEFSSTSGNSFILNEDVDFLKSTNDIVVAQVNTTTGIPTSYAIKASGQIISGELFRQTMNIGSFVKFLRLELDGYNITEVVSVFDSEGHQYFEVDFLSQDVIYVPVSNHGSDKDVVTNIMKPVSVPRRFVVEREGNSTFLQFGYGSSEEIKFSSVVDPSTVVLQQHGKSYSTDVSFDPTKLISTDKFGVAPANTVLTIVTRNNSTANVNAAAGTITIVNSPIFEFIDVTTLDNNVVAGIKNSLEVTNEEPVVGDVTLPSSEELKRRIYDVYASQNRAVTKSDYVATCYQMPAQFGCIKRAAVVQDNDSFKRNLNLYVLAENQDGTLTVATSTLKSNLKTWLNRNRMINDTVDILDAVIINLGIVFEAVVDDEKNRYTALSEGTNILIEMFTVQKDIGENFSITDVYSALKMVPSILDVTSVKIVNKYGGSYSDSGFNVDMNTSADGRMVYCPENYIFEIKFPQNDIKGSVK
ncbi:MAG: hypothetical protein H7831_12440 [Magnetococcus sp. WYHC-3]